MWGCAKYVAMCERICVFVCDTLYAHILVLQPVFESLFNGLRIAHRPTNIMCIKNKTDVPLEFMAWDFGLLTMLMYSSTCILGVDVVLLLIL